MPMRKLYVIDVPKKIPIGFGLYREWRDCYRVFSGLGKDHKLLKGIIPIGTAGCFPFPFSKSENVPAYEQDDISSAEKHTKDSRCFFAIHLSMDSKINRQSDDTERQAIYTLRISFQQGINMDAPELTRKTVWRRLAIVIVFLFLLIGPNFGPIPTLLSQYLSIKASVIALLGSFWIGFCIIIAVILRMSNGMNLKELLSSLGLGAPSRMIANIAGLALGLLWGFLFLTSIFQFDPDAQITQISGLRVFAALLAAGGALLEDFVTRGYLMNQLHQINIPRWVQVSASALIFALYHTIWGFNIISFIFSLVYGLLLGSLFLWGKRSLTPVILGHSLAVLISEPFATMMIFMAAGM